MISNYQPLLVDILSFRSSQGLETSKELLYQLKLSAMTQNLVPIRDAMNRIIAYIAWADIDRFSLERLVSYGQLPTYPFEWEEGPFSLIVDVTISTKYPYEARRKIRAFLKSRRAFVTHRRNSTKLYLKSQRKFQIKAFAKR